MADDPAQQKKPEACSFVIFGVTGDLAHRLIIPALYNLASKDLLPDDFCVVGVARKPMSNDELRTSLLRGLHEFATRPVDDAVARRLLACVTCIAADPNVPGSFENLDKQLDRLESERKSGGNRLYYLATPPNAFAPISRELGRCGMLREHDGVWRRLVIEKPFGTDLLSAKALNDHLLKVAGEQQIYRIDHYLGKETVQNILVLRFANGMFEPIWNRNHIDHVQIIVEEKLGVGHRGSFYDATGALRDMLPNHLFQLLSLVAMEPPARFDAHAVRTEKAEVLTAIQMQSEAEALQNSVRGQYAGYREAPGVDPDSQTETFIAMRTEIDNWRWSGVPFFLRTGKSMGESKRLITIAFREPPRKMFRDAKAFVEDYGPDHISFDFGDPGGITTSFLAKVPGPRMRLGQAQMKFSYEGSFNTEGLEAYERLLYDAMLGDRTLFTDSDGIERLWAASSALLEDPPPLHRYAQGSYGPQKMHELIAPRRWWLPTA